MSTPRRRTRSMSGSEDEGPKPLTASVPSESAGSVKSSRKGSMKPALATVAASPSPKAKKVAASSAKVNKNSTSKRPREVEPQTEPKPGDASDDSDAVWAPAAGSDDDDDSGSDNEYAEAKDLEIDYTTGDRMSHGKDDVDRASADEGEENHAKDGAEGGEEAEDEPLTSAASGDTSTSNVLASSDAELAAERAEKTKARQLAKYKRFGEKLANRGVVYIAKVPPFMKVRDAKLILVVEFYTATLFALSVIFWKLFLLNYRLLLPHCIA